MAVNPYSKYQEQSIMTMTHGEMLTKLYEEAIKQLNSGVHYIQTNDPMMANLCLQKAQKIISYLRATLDMKYEISGNLSSLYVFFNEQILRANIRKETKPLEDIIPMLGELRDTFIQADKLARMEKQPTSSIAPSATAAAAAAVMMG